jgi:hypothetical protein
MREAAYQAALREYSKDLHRGLTRREVEAYLRARNTTFSQTCCGQAGDYADVILVGIERPPWYCSESYVYVAIEFSAVEPHDWRLDILPNLRSPGKASFFGYDSDVLARIELYRPDTGCL